ncbi:hypothetical protein [Dactylosporangium sp. NPDC000521]|uniref:hypothetical protein n=1 Tax=Dactylosporangium sp. NPDC000521 TaxID=3363975 RepID=UPI00368713B7
MLDLEAVASKRLELIGVTFRTHDADERALVHAMRHEIGPGIEVRVLKPSVAVSGPC